MKNLLAIKFAVNMIFFVAIFVFCLNRSNISSNMAFLLYWMKYWIGLTKTILLDSKYDHLVNYFRLMYRYGINTNILHLIFSRAEF